MNKKIKNHIINLYLVALSDGHFASEELDTILKIGEEKGFSKKEFEKAISQPDIAFHLPENFIERIKLLYDFVKVILADGKIDDDEKTSFLRFCKKFQFEEEESNELFSWLIDLGRKNIPTEQLEVEIQKQMN